jgi:hypothetical protein
MKKRLLTSFLTLTVVGAALAQTKPRNTVGLTLGWQNFRMVDQHASPLQYGTNSIFPRIGLTYAHQNNTSFYEIKLSGSKGNLNPARFGARNYVTKWSGTDSFQYQISSAFINANVEASYYRNMGSLSSSKTQYWVGAKLHESAYYGDEVANFPWVLNTLDLSPSFALDYRPAEQHQIGFKVDIAVVGLVTRAVYSLFPKSNKDKNVPAYLKQGTRLASIDKYQKVHFQVDYKYKVSKHVEVGAAYRLKWMHYSYPKSLKALDKHFDINFAYTY